MGQNEDDEEGCGCVEVVALLSGGKDSIFNVHSVAALGAFRVVAAATLRPPADTLESDSFMFQSACTQMLEQVAAAIGLPLFVREIRGAPLATTDLLYEETQGDEVEDLFLLLQDVKPQLLQEMISWKMHAILVKVAALGLGPADIGKSIEQEQQRFRVLDKSFGFHQCGEGGEYETLVLDCPLYFFFSLSLDQWDLYTHSDDDVAPVLLLQPRRYKLIPKTFSGVYVHHKKKCLEGERVADDTEDQTKIIDGYSRKAAAGERREEKQHKPSLFSSDGTDSAKKKKLLGSCCCSSCKADPTNHCAATTSFSCVSAQESTANSKSLFHCRSTSSFMDGSTEEYLQNTRVYEDVNKELHAEGLRPGFVGDVAPPCCYSSSAPTYPACKFLRKVRFLSFYFPAKTWRVVTCAAAAYKEGLLSCFKDNPLLNADLRKKEPSPLCMTTSHFFSAAEDEDTVQSSANQLEPASCESYSLPAWHVLQDGLAAGATGATARAGGPANVACAALPQNATSTYIGAMCSSSTNILPQCLNARRCGNRIIISLNFLPSSAGTKERPSTSMRHFMAACGRVEEQKGRCSAFLSRLQSAVVAVLRRLLPAARETPAQLSSNNSIRKYSIGNALLVYNNYGLSGSSTVGGNRCSKIKDCLCNNTSIAGSHSEDHADSTDNSTGTCSSSICGAGGVSNTNRSGSSSSFPRREKRCESACHPSASSKGSDGSACKPLNSFAGANVSAGYSDYTHSNECSSTAFTAYSEAEVICNRFIAAATLAALSSAARQPFTVVSLSLPLPTARCRLKILVDILATPPLPPGWPLSCHLCLSEYADSPLCAGYQRSFSRTCISEKSDACPSDPPLSTCSNVAGTACSSFSFQASATSESASCNSGVAVGNGSVAQLPPSPSPSPSAFTMAKTVAASSLHASDAKWQASALRFTPEQHLFTRGLNLWVPPVAILPQSSLSKATVLRGLIPLEGAADMWPNGIVQEMCGVLATDLNQTAEGDICTFCRCAPCYGHERNTCSRTMCYWKEEACYRPKTQPVMLSGNVQLRKRISDVNDEMKTDGEDMEGGARGLQQQMSVHSSSCRAGTKCTKVENGWQSGFRFKCCQAIRCRRQRVKYTYAWPVESYVCSQGEKPSSAHSDTSSLNHHSTTSGSIIRSCARCGRTKCCQSDMVCVTNRSVCCCNSKFISISSGDNVEAADDYTTDKSASGERTSRMEKKQHTYQRSIAVTKDTQCCDCQCTYLRGCDSADTDEVPERPTDVSGEGDRCGSIRFLRSEPELMREDETSQLLIGGVSGRMPHSNAFPVYSSVAAGREVHECAGAELKVSGAHSKSTEASSVATEQSDTTVVAGSTATELKALATSRYARAVCTTAVASALAESLAVEVAAAARNLQQTIRLCGGALASVARSGATEEGEPTVTPGESDSEEGLAHEAVVTHREAASKKADDYDTDEVAANSDAVPLPSPPRLLFAFLSREAVRHPENSYSGSTAAAAEAGNDGEIKHGTQQRANRQPKEAAHFFESKQVKSQPPLQKPLLESDFGPDQTSVFAHVSATTAVLKSMKMQLQKHLLPRTGGRTAFLQARSRTVERNTRNEYCDAWEACRQAGSRGQRLMSKTDSNSREDGSDVDMSGSSKLRDSVVEENLLRESRGSFAYQDGHLSEMLVIPAVVDGDLQGGGNVLLWPLGIRGPPPLHEKTETIQFHAKRGSVVSAFHSCSLAGTADNEDAKAADETAIVGNCRVVPRVKHASSASTDGKRQCQTREAREDGCIIKKDVGAAEGVDDGQVKGRGVQGRASRRESCSLTSHLRLCPPIGDDVAMIREKRLFCCRKRNGRTLLSDCVISLELVMQEGRTGSHQKKTANWGVQRERRGGNDKMGSLAGIHCEYHKLKYLQLRREDASSGVVDDAFEKSSGNADSSSYERLVAAEETGPCELSECRDRVASTRAVEENVNTLTGNVDEILTDDASSPATQSRREGPKDKAHLRCSKVRRKREEAVMTADASLTKRVGQMSTDTSAPRVNAVDAGVFELETHAGRRDLPRKGVGVSSVAQWHIRIQEVATLLCKTVLDEADKERESTDRRKGGANQESAFSLDDVYGSNGGQRAGDFLGQHVKECLLGNPLPPDNSHLDLGRYSAEWGAVVISLVAKGTQYTSAPRYGNVKLKACVGVEGEEANMKDKGETQYHSVTGPFFSSGMALRSREHFVERHAVEGREFVEDFAKEENYIKAANASCTSIKRENEAWGKRAGDGRGQGSNRVERSGRSTMKADVRCLTPSDDVRKLNPGEEPLLTALVEKVTEAILRIVRRTSAENPGKQLKKLSSCEERNDKGFVVMHKRGCYGEHSEGEHKLIHPSSYLCPLDDLVVYVLYVCSRIKEIFACGQGHDGESVNAACAVCVGACGASETPSSVGTIEAAYRGKEKLGENANPVPCFACTGQAVFQGPCGTQKKASEGHRMTCVHSILEEEPLLQNEANILPEVKGVCVHGEDEVDKNERSIPTDDDELEHVKGNAEAAACGGFIKPSCRCGAHVRRCRGTYEETPADVGALWESCFRQRLSATLQCKTFFLDQRTKEFRASDNRSVAGELPTCTACEPLQRTEENAFPLQRAQQENTVDEAPGSSSWLEKPLSDASLPGGLSTYQSLDIPIFFFPVCSLENEAVVQVVAVAAP